MVKKTKQPSIDLAKLQAELQSQFRGLDPNDPSLWPVLPRALLLLVLAVVVVVALWYAWLGGYSDQLTQEQVQEQKLKDEFTMKVGKAVNLEPLKAQLEQVRQYVTQLEKQLPSKAEMDQLLSDINQAGIGRSLQFELFRPGAENMHDYYAELPISVRVSGSYGDVGLFASDIAALSRIVTLNNISLAPVAGKSGILGMDATAKTFRYLDPEELAAQKTKPPAGKKG
jgi:type IV pilus assembly protein PilO